MKIKIKVDMNDGTPAVELTTNLFVVCEWERIENRRSHLTVKESATAICAVGLILILQMRGDTLPNDWRKWVKANPNMDITGADETVGNPTGLVLTEGS
jgi:hypothetical protein